MYELKKNVDPTYAVRPSMLNCPKRQKRRGCTDRVRTPERLMALRTRRPTVAKQLQPADVRKALFLGVAFVQQLIIGK